MTYVNHKVLNYTQFYNPETSPYLNPSNDRRVAVVTGASAGIGWFTVLHLYLHGYIVYIFGRSDGKVLKAIEDIHEEASRRVEKYGSMEKSMRWLGELHYIHIDLVDLRTIDNAVYHFSLREKTLHILVCNAGIMGVPFEVTRDGFELQHQVNYVSHFLLTLKLLPFIKNVARARKIQPRIVTLSSFSHKFVYKTFPPGEFVKKNPDYVFTWVRYGLSKLALIHFAKMLNKYFPYILSVSVHPGFVLNTELYNHWKQIKFIGIFAKGMFKAGDSTIGVTNEEGSFATLRAALDTSLCAKRDGGKYYITGGQEAVPSIEGTNMEAAQNTWDWTIKELKARHYIRPEEMIRTNSKRFKRKFAPLVRKSIT
ncbi:probable oxidoreductase Env9p [[Candida] railenensis]|uniref:Probable oxidoreductase Env9p n=1 Tax=[Candida] railenensis TaxID=45579 RepID=A0A9P0QN50_9ASCO|nr:probable oxidoreductase Env9p [[Candida] railenensis]